VLLDVVSLDVVVEEAVVDELAQALDVGYTGGSGAVCSGVADRSDICITA
jgi:hypothetical protein